MTAEMIHDSAEMTGPKAGSNRTNGSAVRMGERKC